MFRSAVPASEDVDGVLAALPSEFVTVDAGVSTVVIGPTGAFVVAEGGGDVGRVVERLGRTADRCRSLLARHLSWTPFVDALVVTDRRMPRSPMASAVPPRMLRDTLVSGPHLLAPETIDRIAELLDEVRGELTARGRPASA